MDTLALAVSIILLAVSKDFSMVVSSVGGGGGTMLAVSGEVSSESLLDELEFGLLQDAQARIATIVKNRFMQC